MKKLLATMLALLMALTLLPTATFAETAQANGLPKAANGVYTLTSDVKLNADVTVVTKDKNISKNSGVIEIKSGITFDGNGKTITAGEFAVDGDKKGINHIISVENGAQVTIKNLTIVGNSNTKHGINVYGENTKVTLKNVTIKNCGTAAIVINEGEVTASGLTTKGNAWYAVNVDKGGKLTLDTTSNLGEGIKVYSEKQADSQCEVNIGNNSQYVLATDKGFLYSSNAADLGVAAIGKNVYATLTDAVAAIEGNRVGTITLLKDCEGDGVKVDDGKGITFDLNGHKYTINKTVGSKGTETNGMQFIKGSTVTIENGEIVFNNAKMGIKNYCDLTLDNVVMTNTAKADPVVNNCGQLTVNGAHTKISGNSKWAITTGNYGKDDVITTTINAGEISGVAIETPQWETGDSTPDESVTITVNGGTIGKLGTWDWATDGSYGDKYKDAPQLTNWKFVVNDGTFETFDFSGKYTDKISFCGGMFGVNPAAYVDDAGYTVVKGTDGRYTVKAVESGSAGGSTGGTTSSSTSSVVLPTDAGSNNTTTTASIPKNDIDTNKGLVVKSASEGDDANVTSVTFNSTAAKTIKTDAGDNIAALNLTVSATAATEEDAVEEANKTAYNTATTDTDTENAVVVSIKLSNGTNNIFTEEADGAYAIVTVPYKTGLENVTVQYLNGNNAVSLTQVDQLNQLADKSFTVNQNGFYHYNAETGVITMKLPHFSQYLLNGIAPAVTPEPVTYTVTFNANGGTVNPTTATTDTNGKLLTSLPVPTRSGYRFDGWYTAADGGTQVTADTVFTADTTVYAHWTRNSYHGPSRVNTGSGSTTTTTPTVAAPKTADAGIAVYGVMAISSVLGMGYMGKKKF